MRSAGVDCVGLVQRSASYGSGENKNAYDLPDISGYTWLQAWNTQRRHIVTIEDRDLNDPESYQLWKITAKPNVGLPDNLDKVIPGDIVYYRGYHVMMVAAVEYEPGSRSTGVERIQLIEATVNNGWNIYFVAKRNTLNSYNEGNMQRDWVIGRLK